ncbi:hypothetical protein IAR50_006908 [Cryptococcus sp. DSM 104548]
MPPTSPLIAVTSINSFIAAEADKIKTHPAYEMHMFNGNLKVVVVEDLAKSDFSELLDGVDAVANVAAPLPNNPKLDNTNLTWDDDFKGPIVEPVLRILQHAQQSTTIKRVALISSLASSIDFQAPPGKVYTEIVCTPYTEEACKALDIEKVLGISWRQLPCISLSRKWQAVLQFQEREKPAFSISVLCPCMVHGPARFLSSLDDTNNSQKDFLDLFAGKDQPLPPQYSGAFVDIRDPAEAFYLAVMKKASGKFLISGHEFTYQNSADRLCALRPNLAALIPLGEPGNQTPYPSSIDASKSKQELGIQYRTMEETFTAANA